MAKNQAQTQTQAQAVFLEKLSSLRESSKREGKYMSWKIVEYDNIILEAVANPRGDVVIRLRTQNVKNALVINTKHWRKLMEFFTRLNENETVKDTLLKIFMAVYGEDEGESEITLNI